MENFHSKLYSQVCNLETTTRALLGEYVLKFIHVEFFSEFNSYKSELDFDCKVIKDL